jgi:hypothetical protein
MGKPADARQKTRREGFSRRIRTACRTVGGMVPPPEQDRPVGVPASPGPRQGKAGPLASRLPSAALQKLSSDAAPAGSGCGSGVITEGSWIPRPGRPLYIRVRFNVSPAPNGRLPSTSCGAEGTIIPPDGRVPQRHDARRRRGDRVGGITGRVPFTSQYIAHTLQAAPLCCTSLLHT